MEFEILWIWKVTILAAVIPFIYGQDVTSCAGSPCQNGAICEDTETGYQCFCVDGYAGENCEINFDDCASIPCMNNGTCIDGVAEYTCNCQPGFTGQYCQTNIDECHSNPCEMNGTCIDLVDGFICECPRPFRGDNCSLLPCDTVPCENEVLCEDDVTFNRSLTGYTCDCILGFSGSRCELNLEDCDLANDTSCTGNGLCVDGINDYSCLCEPGWIGNFCQLPVNDCIGNDCRNNGTCNDQHLGYTCTCPPGYEGDLCERERDECTTWYPCQNEAVCVDLFNDYRCECDSGWVGDNCTEEVNECLTNPCINGGQCLDIVGDFVCRCPPFFTGNLCETPYNPCSPDYNQCLNGAICIAPPDGNYVCFCTSGYTGTNCEVNINECLLYPCENNATCEDITAGYICHCRSGWTGDHCLTNIDDCISQPCPNGATCFDFLNGYSCNCTPEYTGRLCQEPVDFCLQQPCYNAGTCISMIGDYRCQCLPPYTGRNCLDLINVCEENSPCLFNSTCINMDTGYECVCQPPLTGKNCDVIIDYCASQPCLNGGSCRQLRDGWICICPIYLTGRQCTDLIDYCENNPCSNGGVCINNEFGFRCLCLFGFSGILCNEQIDFCVDDPCLNSGNCSNLPGGFICSCTDGHIGDFCELEVSITPTMYDQLSVSSSFVAFSNTYQSTSLYTSEFTHVSTFEFSSDFGTFETAYTEVFMTNSLSTSSLSLLEVMSPVISSNTVHDRLTSTGTSTYLTEITQVIHSSPSYIFSINSEVFLSSDNPSVSQSAKQTISAFSTFLSSYITISTVKTLYTFYEFSTSGFTTHTTYMKLRSSEGTLLTSSVMHSPISPSTFNSMLVTESTILLTGLNSLEASKTILSEYSQSVSLTSNLHDDPSTDAKLMSATTRITDILPSVSTVHPFTSIIYDDDLPSSVLSYSVRQSSPSSTKLTPKSQFTPLDSLLSTTETFVARSVSLISTDTVDRSGVSSIFSSSLPIEETATSLTSNDTTITSGSLSNVTSIDSPMVYSSSSMYLSITEVGAAISSFDLSLQLTKMFPHISVYRSESTSQGLTTTAILYTDSSEFSQSDKSLSTILPSPSLMPDTFTNEILSSFDHSVGTLLASFSILESGQLPDSVSTSESMFSTVFTLQSPLVTNTFESSLFDEILDSRSTFKLHDISTSSSEEIMNTFVKSSPPFYASYDEEFTPTSATIIESSALAPPINLTQTNSEPFSITSDSGYRYSSMTESFQRSSIDDYFTEHLEVSSTPSMTEISSLTDSSSVKRVSSMTDSPSMTHAFKTAIFPSSVTSSSDLHSSSIESTFEISSSFFIPPTSADAIAYSSTLRSEEQDISQTFQVTTTKKPLNTLQPTTSLSDHSTRLLKNNTSSTTSTNFFTLSNDLDLVTSIVTDISDSYTPKADQASYMTTIRTLYRSNLLTSASLYEISELTDNVLNIGTLPPLTDSEKLTMKTSESIPLITLSSFSSPVAQSHNVLKSSVDVNSLVISYNPDSSLVTTADRTVVVSAEVTMPIPSTVGDVGRTSIPISSTKAPTTSPPITQSCDLTPCRNGGVCKRDLFGFYCDCAEGFVGIRCETATTACDGIVCENGGICSVVMTAYNQKIPVCSCPLPFTGILCIQELLLYYPSFRGQSYLVYDSPRFTSTSANEIVLKIKTTQSNGTILFARSHQPITDSVTYMGNPSFIRLHILDGKLYYTFTCDGILVSDVKTNHYINTGDTYEVIIRQMWPADEGDWCTASVIVNTDTYISVPVLTTLPPSPLGDLVLGGILRSSEEQDGHDSGSVIDGFIGCVQGLQINRVEQDMVTSAKHGMNVENCNVPVCQHNPCKNGATCHSISDDWYCECPPGYGGDLCETKLCGVNPCLHGGTCIVLEEEKDTLCICPYGAVGTLCETGSKPTMPHFSGTLYGQTSYLAYINVHYMKDNFEMEFNLIIDENSTISNLILYMGSSYGGEGTKDFLLVGLIQGYLLFRYDLGSGQADLYSPGLIDLSLSHHRVQLGRDGRRGWLKLDDHKNVTGQSAGSLTALNVRPVLYVGGLELDDTLLVPQQARLEDGLKGCVYNLKIKTFHSQFTVPGSPPGHVDKGRNVRECSEMSCDTNPCRNEAECVEIGSSIFCNCSEGWKGIFCSETNTVCDLNHTCSTGSTCLPVLSGGYKCLCPLGTKGDNCSEDITISDALFLGEESYMAFEPVYIKKTIDIELEIKPTKPTCLLFYVALRMHSNAGDFLSIFLYDWTLELRFSLGSNLNVIRSKTRMNLQSPGDWQSVRVGRNSTHGYVSVNNDVTVTMTTDSMLYLDTTSDFYLGGVPALNDVSPLAFENEPVTFEGCIRRFRVNEKTYELTRQGALSGRNIQDCDGTACGYSTCKNGGQCHVIEDGDGFNCTCTDGFYGDRCTFPIECRMHSCIHGNCVVDNPYSCECHLGWTGVNCDTETELGTSGLFQGKSYILHDVTNDAQVFRNVTQISLSFRTTSLHGLLFWNGQTYTDDEDYLGVGVSNGRVKLVWNLGWYSRTETVSTKRYDDGQWHFMNIYRIDQEMTLTLDDVIYISRVSGDFYQLDTGNGYSIGGFKEGPVKFNTLDHFTEAFNGCIRDFTVNGQIISFQNALEGLNIAPCDPTGMG